MAKGAKLPPHSPSAAGGGARRAGDTTQTAALPRDEFADAPIGALPADTVRVAFLVPLTGSNARVGQDLLDAAQLALFESGNRQLAILPFDTRGTAEGAARAASRAVEAQARLIIGPLLAASVEAVAPIAREARINVVAFSNSSAVAGDGVYILGHVPGQQTEQLIDYAYSQGLIRFAVLAPRGAYGETVVDTLRRAAFQRGVTLTRVQYYDPEATDFSEQVKLLANYDARRSALQSKRRALEAAGDEASRRALRQLESRDTLGEPPFDAVVLPTVREQNLRTIASLLAYYDVDPPGVRVLGLQIWDEFDALTAESSLVGAWYVAPARADRAAFSQRFRNLYGRLPQRLAPLGYDAIALAAVLAGRVGTADYSRTALTGRQGFFGVDGLFRLEPTGVARRGLAVHEIVEGAVVERRAAPDRFDLITN